MAMAATVAAESESDRSESDRASDSAPPAGPGPAASRSHHAPPRAAAGGGHWQCLRVRVGPSLPGWQTGQSGLRVVGQP